MNPRFNQGAGFSGNMGGFGGGFDPSSVAMMYQNMMKTGGKGNTFFDLSQPLTLIIHRQHDGRLRS